MSNSVCIRVVSDRYLNHPIISVNFRTQIWNYDRSHRIVDWWSIQIVPDFRRFYRFVDSRVGFKMFVKVTKSHCQKMICLNSNWLSASKKWIYRFILASCADLRTTDFWHSIHVYWFSINTNRECSYILVKYVVSFQEIQYWLENIVVAARNLC